jgi:hypothetical protein
VANNATIKFRRGLESSGICFKVAVTIVTGRATKEGVLVDTFFLPNGPFHFTLPQKMFTVLRDKIGKNRCQAGEY